MVEFKTYYNSLINLESFLYNCSDINNSKGVFYIKYSVPSDDKFISNSKVFITKNLGSDIKGAFSNLGNKSKIYFNKYAEKLSFHMISFAKIDSDITCIQAYLKLIKLYDPNLNFEAEVKEILSSLSSVPDIEYDFSIFDYLDKSQKLTDLYITDLNDIPNTKGVYFIYDKDYKLMYIGKSIHIHNRLKEHLGTNSHISDVNHNFKYFKYIELSVDDVDLDNYETYYINLYKPLLNTCKTYSYTSQRYNPKFNKAIRKFNNLEHYLRFQEAKKYIESNYDIEKLLKKEEDKLSYLKELIL